MVSCYGLQAVVVHEGVLRCTLRRRTNQNPHKDSDGSVLSYSRQTLHYSACRLSDPARDVTRTTRIEPIFLKGSQPQFPVFFLEGTESISLCIFRPLVLHCLHSLTG